jgi:5-(carboxyamino)imidazole ribonucleotide synthase
VEKRKQTTIYPGQTIGILGGGQLGRMIALAARNMGYRLVTLDPTPDAPCGQVSDEQIVAPFTNADAAKRLAERSDVVTYEFENVDATVAAMLEQFSFVPQGSALLRTTQHRHREKQAILSTGVDVVPYVPIRRKEELLAAVGTVGFPCVLKTTQGGYDGKGQWLIHTPADIEGAWCEWVTASGGVKKADLDPRADEDDYPLIAERFIPFEQELSVVVARNAEGETACFPTSENIHQSHILHLSIVPARIPTEIEKQAVAIAERIATSLQVVGLLAVEMFLTADGRIYVNELAPRPHNSGHFSMDACVTSQFEQHIRAVCGLPMGSTKLLSPVVMVNILGEHVDALMQHVPQLGTNVKLHLYGKQEAKPKRKMGHLNVLAESVEEALQQIADTGIWRSPTTEEESL